MRYFAELQYDGTQFHGWQTQPNALSVQEFIADKLSMILNSNTPVMGCGRTDTGVHARQFFMHFDTGRDIPADITYRMNQVCGNSIAFRNFWRVPDTVHARFDATARTYHYYLHNLKNPFKSAYSYYFKPELDLNLMNNASVILLANTDFVAFCKSHAASKTSICHLSECEWIREDDNTVFRIKADRFLRNMVRAIVGTMLQIGQHRMTLSEFESIIVGGNRSAAGDSAPAHGLFLEEVEYNQTYWELIG